MDVAGFNKFVRDVVLEVLNSSDTISGINPSGDIVSQDQIDALRRKSEQESRTKISQYKDELKNLEDRRKVEEKLFQMKKKRIQDKIKQLEKAAY